MVNIFNKGDVCLRCLMGSGEWGVGSGVWGVGFLFESFA